MNTLKDEIEKTINWMAQVDMQNNGAISEGTKEAARVQDVQIYMPDPMVMEYTKKNGRKEGLLYNNRIHWMGRGDGTIQHTGLAPIAQYDANRIWILENFKNKQPS